MTDSATSTTPAFGEPTDPPQISAALFIRLTARANQIAAVDAFLREDLSAVADEPGTTTWYAIRFGERDFAIFDTFPGDEARLAHLAGKVGHALVARTPELLDGAPSIEKAKVLAYKVPGEKGQVPP